MSLQNGACFIENKLENTGPAAKERVASVSQSEQLARTPQPLSPKEKNKAICPDQQIVRGERVKVSESRPWREKGGSEREHGEERVDPTVKENRF